MGTDTHIITHIHITMSGPSSMIRSARYGALGVGLLVGFFNSGRLERKKGRLEAEHTKKVAREERRAAKAAAAAAKNNSVISDPEDPNFDIDLYIKSVEARQ